MARQETTLIVATRRDAETLPGGIEHAAGYVLTANNGRNGTIYADADEHIYPTRKAAYDACRSRWPSNSVWHGRKVGRGYRIDL